MLAYICIMLKNNMETLYFKSFDLNKYVYLEKNNIKKKNNNINVTI